jgi:tetratricopeptide (TPR) repeat protein
MSAEAAPPSAEATPPKRAGVSRAALPAAERGPLVVGVALLTTLAVIAWGLDGLDRWIDLGTTLGAQSWTDRWPLALLASLVVLFAVAVARRPGWVAVAGATLAWGLGLAAVLDLPAFPLNIHYPDTPAAIGVYAALGFALGAFALAGPRSWGAAQRVGWIALFGATANGKLFGRAEADATFALLAGSAALALLASTPRVALERDRGPRRLAFALGAAVVLWTFAAGWLGDSPSAGWTVGLRVLLGATLAWTLARSLDERGVVRAIWALILGWAACFLLLGVGLADAAAIETVERVAHTRLRLLGMHANGIGTLFAMGLAGGLLIATGPGAGHPRDTGPGDPGSRRPARALGALLALACAVALWRTESAASQAGAALGALVALVLPRLPLPRRTWPLGAGLTGCVALGVGLWLSPLADGLRERLDALTHGPSALGQRWHFWRMSLAAAQDSPWFGVGPNQYYVHARFAEPSYYDGTSQTLHSHNLWLGWAEGAGWPFAVLGSLLAWAVLVECVRRMREPVESEGVAPNSGPWIGGFFACTTVALLAANTLDLGQSQSTFVPLWLWIALGATAALGNRGAKPAGGRPAFLSAALPPALLLLLAGCWHTLAVDSAWRRGTQLQDRGDTAEALEYFERGAGLNPWDSAVRAAELNAIRVLGPDHPRFGQLLRLSKEVCDLAPRRATHWRRRAKVCLGQGKWEAARSALDRAEACDPRGTERAEVDALRVWLCFAENDRLGAGSALLDSVRSQGRPWEVLGQRSVPDREPGAPEGAQRIFLLSPTRNLPFDRDGYALRDLIDTLSDLALESATADMVASRRYLRSAVEGYMLENRPDLALELMERHEELRGAPMPSLYSLRLACLKALGDAEAFEAVRLDRLTDWNATTEFRYLIGRYHAGERRTREEWWSAIEPLLDSHDRRDLFFEAAEHDGWFFDLSLMLRDIGRPEAALRWLRRSLRDTADVSQRAERAVRFYQGCQRSGGSAELLLGSFAIVAEELGRARRGEARPEDWRALAAELYGALGRPGVGVLPLAERRLGGSGYAGQLVLEELRRLAETGA